MIVAPAELELLKIGAQPVTDARGLGEIERRAGDRGDLTGRNEGGIDRCVVARIELKLVTLDAPRSLAR